jgi:hypothetical protein
MDPSLCNQAALLDLPLEVLTTVCLQLDLRDSVRVAATCKRFRHGDGGLETLELMTKSPVVTALLEHAFPGGHLVPSTHRIVCSESWVAYLARCARQRRRENPPVAAWSKHSLFVEAAGRLFSCGKDAAVGHGDAGASYTLPTLVAAMAGVRVRSVAAGHHHSLALSWDGRVYSWGKNDHGELGHGDTVFRPSPVLVEGLEGVCSIAAAVDHSYAVTQSGDVFHWGTVPWRDNEEEWQDEESEEWDNMHVSLEPTIVEGFGGVRVR